MRLQLSLGFDDVVVCRGAELQIFIEDAWRRAGEPAFALLRVEVKEVATFLPYRL